MFPAETSLEAASAFARMRRREPTNGSFEFISRGDDDNYCVVNTAVAEEKALTLCGLVVGTVFDPCLAEAFSSPSQLFEAEAELDLADVQTRGMQDGFRHEQQMKLCFTSASRIDIAKLKELHFRYAPGYSAVSLLALCLQARAQEEILPQLRDPFHAPAWCAGTNGYEAVLKCTVGLTRNNWSLTLWIRVYTEDVTPRLSLTPASRQTSKREDGFVHKSAGREMVPADASAWSSRAAAACTVVEARHSGIVQLLARRLRSMQVLRETWAAGDAVALAQALEECRDDSLTAACLNRFVQHPKPLPADSLARLLPLAQKLAQADSEEHAVAAVRFVLHSLRVSWPAIAKLLRSVATSRAALESCEEAVVRLQSLYSTVKALSRSVKVSKTNGPLVPLCKKLKVSLEEALAGAGRLRS